jgi:hypothetical protein
MLITLASNLEKLKFDYNEIIVRKGKIPEGLYMII